jgi:osmotically-inducible protein OsmY
MKVILLCSLVCFGGGQPPVTPAGTGKAPQKKEAPEGDSDLQKLTPTVLQNLAKQIEAALIGDVVTGTLGLRVSVDGQMLVINGDAPDEAARKRASEIATNVANDELYRITNRVRIRAPGDPGTAKKPGVTDTPTAPDLAQVERVDAVLREKLPELSRTIRARFRVEPMPCIVLEGVVDTMEQKLEVSRTVRTEFKALPLLNNITLRIKQPATPAPRPAENVKQPKQLGPQNKAVAIDSDTREEDVPLAGAVGTKIMGDARIWDTVVLVQADGGLIWLKGTVETFPMKVRCVNLAQRTEGVTYVIDDLTVAVALRGAKELSVAKQKEGVSTEVLVDDDAVVYFKRYLRESVPAPGAYTVESKEGTIRVVLRSGLLTPEELKRVGDSVQKLAADLGVKAVVDVRPGGTGTAPAIPPPAP